MFTLHPILDNDTALVTNLSLCRVLQMNDARYPWLILVPQREDVREMHHLSPEDQSLLFKEMMQASNIIEALYTPDKINVGALGNLVPQLHIHVIARYKDDAAWPGPVWGHSAAVPYIGQELETRKTQLMDAFNK